MSDREIVFKPIGFVSNEVNQSMDASFDWAAVTSQIVLNEAYREYTKGLEKYSHILVIFWMDRPVKKKLVPLVHPRGDKTVPMVGLFASRSPHRPNPAGLKLVELVRVEKNLLMVRGLDALNGTPVVDIKPYHPGYDSLEEPGAPSCKPNQPTGG